MNMEVYMSKELPKKAAEAVKLVNEALASNALKSSKVEWELWMEQKGATYYRFTHEYGSR